MAADLFSQYSKDGSLTAKQLLVPLIDRLIGERFLRTDLPVSGKAAAYKKDGALICHLWYANTIKRGDGVEVIEDIVTLSKVDFSVKCDKKPQSVVLQPSGQALPFTYENGRVNVSLSPFNCYQIVEIL